VISSISSSSRWVVAGCAAAIFVLAIDRAPSLRAAPAQSGLAARVELSLPGATVDRSRKGDRLDHAQSAAPPVGCDRPFSALAKVPAPNLIARCLT
jgi:hypothetical protein